MGMIVERMTSREGNPCADLTFLLVSALSLACLPVCLPVCLRVWSSLQNMKSQSVPVRLHELDERAQSLAGQLRTNITVTQRMRLEEEQIKRFNEVSWRDCSAEVLGRGSRVEGYRASVAPSWRRLRAREGLADCWAGEIFCP